MAIELGTIVEIVTAIPNILNSIATLSSALKIGFGGSKSLWGQMRREIDELRGKIEKVWYSRTLYKRLCYAVWHFY